jgi:hypothetical protein
MCASAADIGHWCRSAGSSSFLPPPTCSCVTFSKQAEKQSHPYIGYDPTGRQGIVPVAEQNHTHRRATTPPPTVQPALDRRLLRPNSHLAHRNVGPVLSPRPVASKRVQAVREIRRLPYPGPIRGPAPIPHPAPIFANNRRPRVHIAKLPIQRGPLVAGHFDGTVHDIQKSSRWDPQYHAGVKTPIIRPY